MKTFWFHSAFNMEVWEGMFIYFYIITPFSCIYLYFASYFLHLLVQLVFQSVMTDPLSSSTPVPPNLLLDLSLNMNLNPKTTVDDNICNIKYRQPDNLYEPVLFEPLKQIKS